MNPAIALVGDYSAEVAAHRAIPAALRLASEAVGIGVEWEWVPTPAIARPGQLERFDGIWLVPGSPYRAMDGAITAVRFARETGRPFLGTCGGFQHALIEFARHVAGITDAEHGETAPQASVRLVAPLTCSLVEQVGTLQFTPGSLIHRAYGGAAAQEGYRCRYGLDERYRRDLEAAGFRFTAQDEQGSIRGGELDPTLHPFFVGTLFQPERAALRGAVPPLAQALVGAVRRAPRRRE